MAKPRSSHVSKPSYPGGPTALRRFVRDHLRYPNAARRAGVEGTVVIRYGLDYRGKVVETRVKKGIGHGCDEEALRVVRLLRFDVPQDRKKKVRIHQDVNIHFRLPKDKKGVNPAPASPQKSTLVTTVSYTVVKPSPTPAAPSSGGYGYTIKW